jgi:hypothetical protein
MDSYSLIIWICPFFTIISAFFTSKIKQFQNQRYTFYFIVLFIIFLLNLQTISFTNDIIDLIFTQIVLLVVADFFWRSIFMKSTFFRNSMLIIAILLLAVTYRNWTLGGPKRVGGYYTTSIVTHSTGQYKGYYVKQRQSIMKSNSSSMELYKERMVAILEKKLSSYTIPEGYRNSTFTFKWHIFNHRIAVCIIGDKDTLWTLTDPGPPK